MQNEESDHRTVSTTAGSQEEPGVKRAREEDPEVKRLRLETEAKGKKIEEVGDKVMAMGEAITTMGQAIARDVASFRAQGKTEEEIQSLIAEQKAQQAELKAQQAELKAQQAELKNQQAELKADRSRLELGQGGLSSLPYVELTEETAPTWVTTAVDEIVATLIKASPALADDESNPVPDDIRFLDVPRPAAAEILELMPEYCPDNPIKAVMMATAVSGAGKTSAFCQVGRTAVVLYVTCARTIEREPLSVDAPSSAKPGGSAVSAAAELTKVIGSQTTNIHGSPGDQPQLYDLNTRVGIRLSEAFILAHLLVAVGFFRAFPNATPYQFMRFQFTTLGQSVVFSAFGKGSHATVHLTLLTSAGRAVKALLASTLEALSARGFLPKLLVVVDEMESFAQHLPNQFRSRSGKNGENFLSAYLQGVRDLADVVGYSLIAAGTGSVLAREESVVSSIGKDGDLISIRYEKFPLASKENVVGLLHKVTGIPETVIESMSSVDEYLVGARYRMVARTCREFDKLSDSSTVSNQAKLVSAVVLAEAKLRSDLVNKLRGILEDRSVSDGTRHERIELLRRVYVASRVSDGVISFTSEWDLCQVGIAVISLSNEFFVEERFVLEAIKQTFDVMPSLAADAEYKCAIAALKTVLTYRGATTASKGDFFENFIAATFLKSHINGKHVLELPFVDAEAAPKNWPKRTKWKGVKLLCDGTAVLGNTNLDNAAAFLLAHRDRLLCPEKEHRADGILLLENKCILELGMKFHSRDVSIPEVRSQFRSTDPACAYEMAEAWRTPDSSSRLNPNATLKCEAWAQAGLDKRTALRVHVTLPRPCLDWEHDAETQPGTYFLPDGSIVVNLDASNIHLLLGVPSSASSASSSSSSSTSSMLSSAVGRLTRSTARRARAHDDVPLVGGLEGEKLRAIYRVLYEVTGAKELLRWCNTEAETGI